MKVVSAKFTFGQKWHHEVNLNVKPADLVNDVQLYSNHLNTNGLLGKPEYCISFTRRHQVSVGNNI